MTFSVKYEDLNNPHFCFTTKFDCDVTDDERERIAAYWVELLTEWDMIDDEDPFANDLLDAFNDVVFCACPELEQRFDKALSDEMAGEADFANGFLWGNTDKWRMQKESGTRITIPVVYFTDLPDEIKQLAKNSL